MKVYVGGKIVPAHAAAVSVWDSGFQHGDSVYEGIRVYGGRLLQLEAHIERLYQSAHAIGITPTLTRAETAEAIKATVRANGFRDNAHLRVTLTRGQKSMTGMDPRLNGAAAPLLVVIIEPKSPVFGEAGVTLITASVRRTAVECLDPKIHSSNQLGQILAKLEANHAGADEALMLDVHGMVAETNSANFFVVRHGIVMTSRRHNCLNGLTRAWVLDNAERLGATRALEDDLSLTDVYTADEAFMCGTVCEVVPVVEVDGRQIGNGVPGPLVKAILAGYREYAYSAGVPVE